MTTFWINDPIILFKSEYITQIWPNENLTFDENLNAVTRITIILTFLGFIITSNYRFISAGIITIIAIIILKFSKQKKVNIEGYENSELTKTAEKYKPTNKNPLMNVLLPEIQDNPERPEAELSYLPNVVDNINKTTQEMVVNNFDNQDGIHDKLFKDLGDNFQFDRSMIQFSTTPNTKIPNDQTSFAKFCYGDMISCKEGNPEACVKTMPPNWTNL